MNVTLTTAIVLLISMCSIMASDFYRTKVIKENDLLVCTKLVNNQNVTIVSKWCNYE